MKNKSIQKINLMGAYFLAKVKRLDVYIKPFSLCLIYELSSRFIF